jgi:hypothetical protein
MFLLGIHVHADAAMAMIIALFQRICYTLSKYDIYKNKLLPFTELTMSADWPNVRARPMACQCHC